MQENLAEHRSELVAVTLLGESSLDGFGDGASKRTCSARMLGKNLPSDSSGLTWRRGHFGTVGAHHFPAERLLLVGAFDHVDLTVKPEIGAGHGQGSAPLTGTGLCGNSFKSLLLGIIDLGDGGVELVAA